MNHKALSWFLGLSGHSYERLDDLIFQPVFTVDVVAIYVLPVADVIITIAVVTSGPVAIFVDTKDVNTECFVIPVLAFYS